MIRLDRGACHDCDPALFHPTAQDQETIEAAQAVCAQCVIRLDCLALALANPDAQGIWGGLTREQRTANRTVGVEGDLISAALVGNQDALDGFTHSGWLNGENECAAAKSHDRVIRHLYDSGLTLARILNTSEVDADVAARLHETMDNLDAATREIRRTAFAHIIQDHPVRPDTPRYDSRVLNRPSPAQRSRPTRDVSLDQPVVA